MYLVILIYSGQKKLTKVTTHKRKSSSKKSSEDLKDISIQKVENRNIIIKKFDKFDIKQGEKIVKSVHIEFNNNSNDVRFEIHSNKKDYAVKISAKCGELIIKTPLSLEKFKEALIIGLQKSQEQRNVYQVATSNFYLGNYYKEIRLNDSAFYFYLKDYLYAR